MAAIRTGVKLMLREFRLEPGDLGRIVVAGAFGNSLDIGNAVALGLLPDVPGSGSPSSATPRSPEPVFSSCPGPARTAAETLAAKIAHVSLATRPDFQDEFVRALEFEPLSGGRAMSHPLFDLAAVRPVLFDGALGTELMARGLPRGGVPELWNVGRPEIVKEIHAAYFAAGADVVSTNSFGASPIKLAAHGLESRTREIELRRGPSRPRGRPGRRVRRRKHRPDGEVPQAPRRLASRRSSSTRSPSRPVAWPPAASTSSSSRPSTTCAKPWRPCAASGASPTCPSSSP